MMWDLKMEVFGIAVYYIWILFNKLDYGSFERTHVVRILVRITCLIV